MISSEYWLVAFSAKQRWHSSVAEYMEHRRGSPSQGWKTFLGNHAPHIAAMDLFVVPTIGFKLLYGLVIPNPERRRLVLINVTANPTAEWIACQITEAFPWDRAPRYLIRDRDSAYGVASRKGSVRWVSGIAPPRPARRGRTAILNASSARSGVSASTMSWCSVKRICAGS